MSDRYAVIGNPIGHTRSPLIHGSFAAATGQDIDYTAIEGPLDGFAHAVHAFRDAGGRGMNVTAPFKLQAFELATDRLERAELAGATNALKFEGDRILADNFDGVGLITDIARNLGVAMKGARVLLLGAGGAARGALLPFLAQDPAELVLVNRTVATATALADTFAAHGHVTAATYAAGGETDAEDTSDDVTEQLMEDLLGTLAVGAAGLVVLGVGAYHVVKGVRRRFREDLRLPEGPGRVAVDVAGVLGYAAKGLALGVVGVLFVAAAATNDPREAGGLDAALRALLELPAGPGVLVAVGVGFAAYGVYAAVRARLGHL